MLAGGLVFIRRAEISMLLDNLFGFLGVPGTAAILLGIVIFVGLPAAATIMACPKAPYARLQRSL